MENQKTTLCLLLLIMCIALAGYFVYPQATNAINLYQEVKEKTQSVEQIKTQVADLKSKKEMHEKESKVNTKPVFKNELEVTDKMSSFGVMFEDVIQSAKYNGLKLRSISYDNAPAEDAVYKNVLSEYNACGIKMKLVGNYSQFRSYFQDIYNYPYLINLDKISIKPYEKNKKILIADVVVTIYSTKNDAQKEAYKAAKAAEAAAAKGDQAVGGGLGAN